MPDPVPADDDLLRRLPLPLARLCVRAHNAKTGRRFTAPGMTGR
jgi:hypothetical protein